MSDFEMVLICLLIPISYVLIYIAGKYDFINLACRIAERNIEELKTRKSMERIIEILEKEEVIAEKELEECIFKALPYHDSIEGKVVGIKKAIKICKEAGDIE